MKSGIFVSFTEKADFCYPSPYYCENQKDVLKGEMFFRYFVPITVKRLYLCKINKEKFKQTTYNEMQKMGCGYVACSMFTYHNGTRE